MTPPRVVAVDLDGTVLRPDKSVSARTRAALDRARAAGARVVAVTARPPRSVDLLVAATGLGGLAVCSNGAIVQDLDAGTARIIHPLPLDVAERAALAVAAALPGAGFAVETGWRVLCEPAYGHHGTLDPSRIPVDSVARLWAEAESAVKLLVWAPDTGVDPALELLRAVPGIACTHSGAPGVLEISAAGVSKAATLAELCAGWGVAPGEVLAFGDMPNDLSVLRWAGTAYAMANAHPTVLSAVERHTASNSDDGVALVLEEYFGR
ncbi:HAD family hydrolase [Longispora urticae]